MTLTGQQLVDTTSRTHLLLARTGAVETLDQAQQHLANHRVLIRVGAAACADPFGQAALLTTITLACRASLTVTVDVDDSAAPMLVGPWRHETLIETVHRLGASTASAADTTQARARISIGQPAPSAPPAIDLDLQVTWDGWIAAIRPSGIRLPERHGTILAAAAGAAFAVSEVFLQLTGHLDAGWRNITVSLWDPFAADPAAVPGPRLDRLPDAWELVGLGHLGQAAAWCLSLLPYRPGDGVIRLVDDDHATVANVSTGILTNPSDAGVDSTGCSQSKTRMVAAALERAGRPTRIIEQRLTATERWESTRPSVALIGVDNFSTRRTLSDIGWPLCIDSGVGATPTSYHALTVYALDRQLRSRDIAAWTYPAPAVTLTLRTRIPAFDQLRATGVDECGIAMLAGRAVAAAFVGMVTACIAVSEPLRRLHGAPAATCIALSLDSPVPWGSTHVQHEPVVIPHVPTADPIDQRTVCADHSGEIEPRSDGQLLDPPATQR